MKFNRGSFIIKGLAQADLEKVTPSWGCGRTRSAPAPSVKTHPARAARVALLHSWNTTQTEGWWRIAFDTNGIPYDYIDPQKIRDTPDLRSKYDVIVAAPGISQSVVNGTPMWRNAIPWRHSTETPNIGTWAQTDDMRIGMGLQGLLHLRAFIEAGGVFIGANSAAEFAISNNFTYGVTANNAATDYPRRRLAAAHETRRRHEPDRLRRARQPRDVQRQRRLLQRERQCRRRRARRWWRRGRGCGRRTRRWRARRPADRTWNARRSRQRAGAAGVRGIEPDAAAGTGQRAAVAVRAADR